MHEAAAFKLEDRLARIPVQLVLLAGVFYGLTGKRILKLQRGDRNAVQA